MAQPRVVMFTRDPERGHAKTQLIPAIPAERAAALHRRLTEHIIGADAPDLTADFLRRAAKTLTRELSVARAGPRRRLLVGRARTRGATGISLHRLGTDRVAAQTLLSEAGIDPVRLPVLADCDRPEDPARSPGLLA